MSKVWPTISEWVACTSGERIPLSDPSTRVGKYMMQMPIAMGRSSGKRSMGSARAIACQMR